MCKKIIFFAGHYPCPEIDFEYLKFIGYSEIVPIYNRDIEFAKNILSGCYNNESTLVVAYSMGAGIVVNALPGDFLGELLFVAPCLDVSMIKGVRGILAKLIRRFNIRKDILSKFPFLPLDTVELINFPLVNSIDHSGKAIVCKHDEMLNNSNLQSILPNFEVEQVDLSHFDMNKMIRKGLL